MGKLVQKPPMSRLMNMRPVTTPAIAGPFMFIEMRYLETILGLNHWIVLLCGYILFTFIYVPLNRVLKHRNDVNYNA